MRPFLVPCVLSLQAFCAGAALAQSDRPQFDPILSSPGVDQKMRDQSRPRTELAPVQPKPQLPAMAGLPSVDASGADYGAAGFPDGTAVSGLVGALIQTAGGDVIFKPQDGPASVLQPCQLLSQMVHAHSGEGRVRLSGIAYSYRGRRFIMPTIFAIVRDEPAPVAPSAPAAPPPDAIKPPTGDPTVESLIKELESRPTIPAGVEAPRTDTPEAATAPAAAQEGSLVVARRARLVRLPMHGGRLAAAMDNDAEAGGPTTLLLLPCRMLERAEALAGAYGEGAAYRASGRVVNYEGRSYLLPVLIQVERKGDIAPAQ